MNPLWIVAAFFFGALVSRIGLPPLVGYLLAGFALNSIGVPGSELLETAADAGVTLLLFTIGLKLKIKTLAKPEIWAGTTIHMTVTVILFGILIQLLRVAGLPLFEQLTVQTSLLVAFALSFSSTVFAVKVLLLFFQKNLTLNFWGDINSNMFFYSCTIVRGISMIRHKN